jgi:molybdopterin biosynthesis enzyme
MKVTTEYHLGGKYDVVVSGGGPSGGANGFFPRVLKNAANCDIIKPERRQVY